MEVLVELQSACPPVIHRDIKPENILVERSQPLKVYLVDFGFARMGGGDVAVSSVVKGTLGFMPPEQLFNRQLTAASDLYSLGATLICLLTGTKSTQIGNLIDDTYRINFKPLVPKLNPKFIDWLEKMTAPNLKNRYPNAATALAALKPIDVFALLSKKAISTDVRKLKKTEKIIRLSILSTLALVGANVYWSSRPVSQLLGTRECQKCDLQKVDIRDAYLRNANLKFANLEAANLESADLELANLESTNLRGANLEFANLEGANLEGAALKLAQLESSSLKGANLKDANLGLVNLASANLEGANLSNSNLWNANLEGANLEGANLAGAKLYNANLTYANLSYSNLSSAGFVSTQIDDNNQSESKWRLVWRIVNHGTEGANLQGVDLRGANLQYANLIGANLEGANLKGADLRFASLTGANLENANLEGAIMPDGTKHE